MKFYYTYKITFIDGCYYYGKRTCSINPKDDIYWGSPVTHKDKWNTMMFCKEIIEIYSSSQECTVAEFKLIKPVYKTDALCLNEGCGLGVNQTIEVRNKISKSKRGLKLGPMSEESKRKKSEANKGQTPWIKGKKHSQETIHKQKESYKSIEHNKGSKNPMFGKTWITNGLESYRINKNDSIPEGYRKGRVIKSSI